MDPPGEGPHTEPGGTPAGGPPVRITLLTDFGTRDGYAAAMRGVLASQAPRALSEEASHAVAPGDIAGAAWALATYWRHYPPGTVHLVVVDPGVGSERQALVARADGRLFVAPDNGVLTRVLAAAGESAVHAIQLPPAEDTGISATFHGRDVFAPAAAALANGREPGSFGPAVADPVRLDLPVPLHSEDVVQGQVVHVDRFGTLVTNVPQDWVSAGDEVQVEGQEVGPVRRIYADVESGDPVALVGSAGLLEVAVRDGSAARVLRCGRGAEVSVSRR